MVFTVERWIKREKYHTVSIFPGLADVAHIADAQSSANLIEGRMKSAVPIVLPGTLEGGHRIATAHDGSGRDINHENVEDDPRTSGQRRRGCPPTIRHSLHRSVVVLAMTRRSGLPKGPNRTEMKCYS